MSDHVDKRMRVLGALVDACEAHPGLRLGELVIRGWMSVGTPARGSMLAFIGDDDLADGLCRFAESAKPVAPEVVVC